MSCFLVFPPFSQLLNINSLLISLIQHAVLAHHKNVILQPSVLILVLVLHLLPLFFPSQSNFFKDLPAFMVFKFTSQVLFNSVKSISLIIPCQHHRPSVQYSKSIQMYSADQTTPHIKLVYPKWLLVPPFVYLKNISTMIILLTNLITFQHSMSPLALQSTSFPFCPPPVKHRRCSCAAAYFIWLCWHSAQLQSQDMPLGEQQLLF